MKCTRIVARWIEEHGLVEPGSRVIAAVSGGPDSMALLELLRELQHEFRFTLGAAYFDHRIRADSVRERALVEHLCSSHGIPLFSGAEDVPSVRRRHRIGLEEAARIARYRFLEDAAAGWLADRVALGHTRDDQIETVMHHIIRGSGWRGLAGMQPQRGIFIRPLLGCTRAELVDLLRSRGIRYAIDKSNRDNRLLRNRIRNLLLPYLRRSYNPAIDDALVRMQQNAAESWKALTRSMDETPSSEQGEVKIPLESLKSLSDYELYLLIDRILRDRFGIMQDITKKHYDAAKKLIRSGRSGGRILFPHGIELLREHKTLVVGRREKLHAARRLPEEALLPGDGIYTLPMWNRTAEIETIDAVFPVPPADSNEAFLASVRFPLRIRRRKPGDRMIPLGMKGRKKLSDLFIDAKVPARRRGTTPVVEDSKGILWVPGIAVSERARITRRNRRMVHITLKEEKERNRSKID